MSFGGMGNMLNQAQQMQARMAKLKEELAGREVEASSGGGAVTVIAPVLATVLLPPGPVTVNCTV